MNHLLDTNAPFAPREEPDFLAAMNAVSAHHHAHCPEYARIWPRQAPAESLAALPWLHVGLFKRIDLVSRADDLDHERTLNSSATSGGSASRITLDRGSSERQAASSAAILGNFLGQDRCPLLVLDSARSLIARGAVSARIAAALSLRPLASDLHFLLGEADDPTSVNWDLLATQLEQHPKLRIYGFTWMLWQALGALELPAPVRKLMAGRTVQFVHSGGWKKLEAMKVDRDQFDGRLLGRSGNDSRVIDFYGLVEQVGIVFPLCEAGFRHAPRWADVLVRDPWTLEPLVGETGLLQLMNTLPLGAPYHNVLTEDLGRIAPGECPCGRAGTRFVLEGRVPSAEIRGCANV